MYKIWFEKYKSKFLDLCFMRARKTFGRVVMNEKEMLVLTVAPVSQIPNPKKLAVVEVVQLRPMKPAGHAQ